MKERRRRRAYRTKHSAGKRDAVTNSVCLGAAQAGARAGAGAGPRSGAGATAGAGAGAGAGARAGAGPGARAGAGAGAGAAANTAAATAATADVAAALSQVIQAEWDGDHVTVYQAFRPEIAEYALRHQTFGGAAWNPTRMTWIKPSFAWVLYRSGYGRKPGQQRVLKVRLTHASFAELLGKCKCKEGGGGSKGRVQWDPARDLYSADGRVPRKMLRRRAIQIGVKADLSRFYVDHVASVEDVTDLAHAVQAVHQLKPGSAAAAAAWGELTPRLPVERDYVPECPPAVLKRLGMLPGATADAVAGLGRGKVDAACMWSR